MFFAPEDSPRPPLRRVAAPRPRPGTANVDPRYDLDGAAWLWHPECAPGQAAFLLFQLDFEGGEAPVELQVSADLRYEIAVDGRLQSRGPDSGPVEAWSFSAYQLNAAPGPHRLDVLVWWAPQPFAPFGRMSWRGGFALAAAGEAGKRFDTGHAAWRVGRLEGFGFGPALTGAYHAIGGSLEADLRLFSRAEARWAEPCVVRRPVVANPHGLVAPGWRLRPAELPELTRGDWRGGRLRALLPGAPGSPVRVPEEVDAGNPDAKTWSGWLAGCGPLTLSAGAAIAVLIDTEDYMTGYPRLSWSGGDGARVAVETAEALYTPDGRSKDDRGVVAGRTFAGWGDRYVLAEDTVQGSPVRSQVRPHWWRAGRYVLLSIRVGEVPLTLHELVWERCGLPVVRRDRFETGDAGLDGVMDLCARGLFASMHDVYSDSPYYEQMMYNADTRLEILLTYITTGDETLPRRGMELMDLSRDHEGFTAMRFPSADRQASGTFPMFWVWMLHDHAYWRDDRAWLRARLPGMRAVLEALHAHRDEAGLLVALPGWLFVDWVPGWQEGWPPGARGGRSALVNLQYLLTLQKAADLERIDGRDGDAERLERQAASVADAVRRVFWDEARGLFSDDEGHQHYSQHAQVWALLAGFPEAGRDAGWADPVPNAEHADLARATVYFQHYLFEALGRLGRVDWLFAYLEFWRELHRRGLKAPVEGPEPSRSDCHAWGSHPLYHMHATVAGVSPAAPGFSRVRVAPQLGALTCLSAEMPHPKGRVAVCIRDGEARVSLPEEVTGVFVWKGREWPLRAGADQIIALT